MPLSESISSCEAKDVKKEAISPKIKTVLDSLRTPKERPLNEYYQARVIICVLTLSFDSKIFCGKFLIRSKETLRRSSPSKRRLKVSQSTIKSGSSIEEPISVLTGNETENGTPRSLIESIMTGIGKGRAQIKARESIFQCFRF